MQNFMPASVRRGYLIWILFKPLRGNASHRVMAGDCSKCKGSEQLDIFWPVRAKVLKTFMRVSVLLTFNVFCYSVLTTHNQLSQNMYRKQFVKYMYVNPRYISHYKEGTLSDLKTMFLPHRKHNLPRQ